MRLGVTLTPGDEVDGAIAAESAGIPFVHVNGRPGTEAAIAAMVATATTNVRIIVSLVIGEEHPVTLAEEIAVLDNVSNGRIGVIAELGRLDAAAAIEDVSVLRASWSGRPLAHRGQRWQVPAGLPGHVAPAAVLVTPAPAQLEIPFWVAGQAAGDVTTSLSVPAVVVEPAAIDRTAPVAPGRCSLTGELDVDRRTVVEWFTAGATHVLCSLTGSARLDDFSRWLIPEVAMVGFPRVVAEASLPVPWPQEAR